MAEEKRRQKKWKLVLNILTIVALLGLIYALREEVFETINNVGRVNAIALLLIIPAQIVSYHGMANMYKDMFAIIGHKLSYKNLWRISLEMNFVNSVFPSGGVSGFSYFGLRMRKEGVSAGQATLIQAFRFILLFVSFQFFLLVGLFLLALEGRANSFTILIAGSLVTLLLVGTAAGAFIIGSKSRINTFFTYITRFINRLIYFFRTHEPETINIGKVQKLFGDLHESYLLVKKDPKMLKRPLLYSLLTNAAEMLTVYVVFVAFGAWVNPGAVIIAYAIANFAGLVSVLPGGVGIYEALMTGVLATAGVPAGISIPVIIMYRILSMLLQLPPGYYYYYKTVHSDDVKA
jgi:glycosyltransferase 2 family protein